MGRKILFVTTDQQRYDSLGCTGGTVARTPVLDGLARQGVLCRCKFGQSAGVPPLTWYVLPPVISTENW